MSAVQKWKERAGKEVTKHPSKLEGETPEATRRWRWKAREKLAEHKLEEQLQRRADEFSEKEKVTRVPIKVSISSSRQDAVYHSEYEKQRSFRRLGRKQFVRKKAEIIVGTGGSLREDPIILGGLFHELGHHVDAYLGYKHTGKLNPQMLREVMRRQMGSVRAKVASERRAWRYAEPYMKGKSQSLKRWAKNYALGTYQGRITNVVRKD